MSQLVDLMKLIIGGGVLVTVVLLVLMALPSSRLRDAILPFAYWGFAIVCGIYVVSPVDAAPEILLGPVFGLVDDAGAVVAGVASIRAAIGSWKQRRAA